MTIKYVLFMYTILSIFEAARHIFSDLKKITHKHMYIYTHICTQSGKNTLKYKKKYIPINKENHLLKIHPLE